MKKLLSCVLLIAVIICLVPASAGAYNSDDVYRDNWNYAMSILKDGEFAYFSVFHQSTFDEMVYDYAYWVKEHNLLPDPTKYSSTTDEVLFAQYKEYYNSKLDEMVSINEQFFEDNFKAEGSELVFSSKGNETIVVYAEKSEIKAVEAMDKVSAHYEGKERSKAQWRIDSENASYFNVDLFKPAEYELVYGLYFYQDHTPEDARYYGPIYLYSPLYNHSNKKLQNGTTDYVLIFAGENGCSPAFSAGEFGNYIIQEYNIYYPYIFGYHIITTNDMRVMTLSEAYEENIPDIMDVFEDYGLGILRGDVNRDKTINIKDATAIQKSLAEIEPLENDYISGFGIEEQITLDGWGYKTNVSDFNHDFATNIKDVTDIQKHIAGIAKNDPDFDDFVPNPIPEPTTIPPRTDAKITIGDKTYEAQVGDTITLTADLTCTTVFRDIFTKIKYDPEILNVSTEGTDNKKEFFKAHCPNLPGGTLIYYGYYIGDEYDKGRVNLSSMSEDGIDFTKEKQLFTFDFNVVSGGDVTIDINLESIYDLDRNKIAENGYAIGSTSIDFNYNLKVN